MTHHRHTPCIPWLATAALCLAAATAQAHGTPKAPATPHGHTPEQTDWGMAGARAQAKRTITIRMSDQMRFTPDKVQVNEGDTVRIVAVNRGRMLHEIVVGTPEELQRHAELMQRFPHMAHDAPYMAHVPQGQRGEIVWTFNRPGEFEFACLVNGHYQAGMRGRITVRPDITAAPATQSPSL